jgi:hypothetical protein
MRVLSVSNENEVGEDVANVLYSELLNFETALRIQFQYRTHELHRLISHRDSRKYAGGTQRECLSLSTMLSMQNVPPCSARLPEILTPRGR